MVYKRISARYYRYFFIFIFFVILSFAVIQLWSYRKVNVVKYEKVSLTNLHSLPKYTLHSKAPFAAPRNTKCTYWDCFNLYQCGNTGHERITVYVYPLKQYVDQTENEASGIISKQFYMILDAILKSKYYTSNPNEACLFVPSIDTLNQDRFNRNLTSRALQSLEFWDGGENHIIFNMKSGGYPDFSTAPILNIGNAMLAAADFDTFSFRVGFDIPIPVYSLVLEDAEVKSLRHNRKWFLVSSQLNIDSVYLQGLEEIQTKYSTDTDILLLDSCLYHNYSKRCDINTQDEYNYPEILKQSTFCTVFRGERRGQHVLLEAMAAGCIPVIIMDSPVMPFSSVLDWKRSAVFIMEDHIENTLDILRKISPEKRREMQKQVLFLYNKYFSSIYKIVDTTLDILQDRVFPHWAKVYEDWNVIPEERDNNPLFLPVTAPKVQGFTAVILTYDRVQSLFTLVEKVAKVPSLTKIVVVWNNQKKSAPSLSKFPKINKPIKIIHTKANKLSNRFYPYKEIETEAILSIDDDIIMLTEDELEFGFEVWREFPDRIVGFPSRTHVWDNATQSWKYESEWTNEISMVLTGAAFYHKYWNYLYTTAMPSDVKDWVDEHMNCEDIAMNFLVANVTKKPPIKVAPRKKFKCPECPINEMLSADLGHMVERSQCLNVFTKAFGNMPLKTVEFRADPVLFKDPFPEKLKRFNEIGSL